MAVRFRKSMKIAPGVRVSVGKKSGSISVGGGGVRKTISTTGRHTNSVGIPGTGLGYTSSSSSKQRGRQQQSYAAPPPKPKAGLFAAPTEKLFAKGIDAWANGDVQGARDFFAQSAQADDKGTSVSDDFLAGILSAQLGDTQGAVSFLETVVSSDGVLPDAMMEKYAAYGSIDVAITDRLVLESAPFHPITAALVLVEQYQKLDRLDEAVGLLQQLVAIAPSTQYLKASLVEILAVQEEWDDLIEIAAGITNEDDVTCEIRLWQARALKEKDMIDAAIQVYTDCLRSKKRDPEMLKAARYGRGRLLLRSGKKARGRKDLELVYADDPNYWDVAELLASE